MESDYKLSTQIACLQKYKQKLLDKAEQLLFDGLQKSLNVDPFDIPCIKEVFGTCEEIDKQLSDLQDKQREQFRNEYQLLGCKSNERLVVLAPNEMYRLEHPEPEPPYFTRVELVWFSLVVIALVATASCGVCRWVSL